MEDLLYILLFVFIICLNLFVGKKNVIKKMFNFPSENEDKQIKNIHKKIQNKQKLYRKQNKKYSVNIPEIKPEIINGFQNFEAIKPQKIENIVQNPSVFLSNKTLKDAVILKEILDLPIALR